MAGRTAQPETNRPEEGEEATKSSNQPLAKNSTKTMVPSANLNLDSCQGPKVPGHQALAYLPDPTEARGCQATGARRPPLTGQILYCGDVAGWPRTSWVHWGGTSAAPTHPLVRGIGRRGVGGAGRDFPLFFLLSFPLCFSFVCICSFLGQAWAEGRGELATSRRLQTADRKQTVHSYLVSP